ncbi:MAG: DNA alkylation repair protein, partial [Clostridia bacterium]|nr:DNA alkylation repair protein [Clostridia bacterium]
SIAKEVAKNSDEYFASALLDYHEEKILYGLVINYAKISLEKKFELLDIWLDTANNWAVTDLVLMGFKDFAKKQNQDVVFNYFTAKLNSKEEFTLRAVIVVLFRYFLTSEYMDETIQVFKNIKSDKYYVNMALAWGVCELLIKDFDKGYDLLEKGYLDKFTNNKAISKARESFRISPENKEKLLALKR